MQLILIQEGLDTDRAAVTIFSKAKSGTRSLTCLNANVIVNGTECAIRTIPKALGSSYCRVARTGKLAHRLCTRAHQLNARGQREAWSAGSRMIYSSGHGNKVDFKQELALPVMHVVPLPGSLYKSEEKQDWSFLVQVALFICLFFRVFS